MPPPGWEEFLDHENILRVRVTTDRRSNIVAFTVQLECLINERWYNVVRYDSAHGQSHIDLINPQGKEYEKIWLGLFEPYNNAFSRALDELKANFLKHRLRFIGQMEVRK